MFIILLFSMIFVHIIMDFVLQGLMSDMKQKDWWLNHPEYKNDYKNDYKAVLLIYGFSWSFAVMLPMIIYLLLSNVKEVILAICIICVLINTFVHAYIDDLKANKRTINLIDDQIFHFIQIGAAWAIIIIMISII